MNKLHLPTTIHDGRLLDQRYTLHNFASPSQSPTDRPMQMASRRWPAPALALLLAFVAIVITSTEPVTAGSQAVFQAPDTSAQPISELDRLTSETYDGLRANKPFGRFLHITDLHPDPHYKHGSAVVSGCHHEKPTKKKKGGKHRAGWWGTGVSDCDTPPRLVESSLKWIAKNWLAKHDKAQEPFHSLDTASTHLANHSDADAGMGFDFIIWTGDSARHDIDSKLPRTLPEIIQLNKWTLAQIEQAFPGVPIVPTFGNNDIFPHNIMFQGPNSITKQFVQIWSDHVPEYEFHTFEQGGYFLKELIPNRLAAMSLNTLYFYDSNKAVEGCTKKRRRHGETEVDPGTAQLDWLEVQLDLFRKRKMQVHLIGHVPPTAGNYFPLCYDRYTDIVIRFQDTIVGQHFGHMNVDAFFIQEDQRAVYAEQEEQEEDSSSESADVEPLKRDTGLAEDLRIDYSSLPGKARTNEDYYSTFFIAPSIIPTYYPGLRVWTFNTSEADRYDGTLSTQDPIDSVASDDDDEEDEQDDEGDGVDEAGATRLGAVEPLARHHNRPTPPKGRKGKKGKKKKNKKKKHSKKLPRHASPLSPSRRNTYLSLLGYSQWVMDIDEQNKAIEKILRREGNEKKNREEAERMDVEYRLEYATYEPETLWSQFLGHQAETDSHIPVPKHLLQAELERLQVEPPTLLSDAEAIAPDEELEATKKGHKLRLPKKLRRLSEYSMPAITVEEMMDLGRRLVVDKQLWKRFTRRIYEESGYTG